MKKVYLVNYFDLKGNFKSNLHCVFETRDLAKGYIKACDNDNYKFVIYEVEYIQQYEQR